jgi:hypothetical protein
MRFQELENKLIANNTLRIEKGLVHVGQDPDFLDNPLPKEILTSFHGPSGIKIDSVARVASEPRKLVVKGTASFSKLGLTEQTEVLATLELVDTPEKLVLTLRYKLPQVWRFQHSFPGLPLVFDDEGPQVSDDGLKTALDSFDLSYRSFYWTTCKHTVQDDDLGGTLSLEEGLTFAGSWVPDGMLGAFEQFTNSGKASNRILYGPVILETNGPLLPLQGDQLPWEIEPRIPGIHLRAALGFDLSFPPGQDAGLKLKELLFHIYSPLTFLPYGNLPQYDLAMAYAGELFIGSTGSDKFATVTAARGVPSTNQLVIAGAFPNLKLNDLAGALSDLAGGKDSSHVLPQEVRDGIGQLGLTNTSVTLFASDNGYEVAATQFTIGMPADVKPWSLFDGAIQLKFESLDIAVVKPFDSEARAMFATLAATTKFGDIALYVEVQYPGFHLSAQQVGTTKINLDYFRDKVNLPKFLQPSAAGQAFEFEIADIAIVAEPGSYYSFSMRVGPSKPWVIDNQYKLPDLRLAVSCETPEKDGPYFNWRFGAKTREGDKAVPVFLLVEKLFEDVGVKNLKAPKALKELTINSLELSYEGRRGRFAAECWGQLPIDESKDKAKLEFGLTIDHSSAQSTTDFGGQILLSSEGQEPLSFSLKFGSGDDSKYCLATYYDPNGYSFNIQSLAKSVLSAEQAALIPASLEISLESALLAYSQQGQGDQEESAVLFGADLGASIKLSDLPIVGSALPADRTIGFESLRVLVASASLGRESVEKLNGLFPKGMKPLPDGSNSDGKAGDQKGLAKGFNVSAVLLFGKTPQTLTLPLGEDDKPTAKPPATAPPSQPNTQPAAAAPPAPAASVKWFEIDKSLGPITVRRIGLSYETTKADTKPDTKESSKVGIKFDATLLLSVLTFNLEGLGLNYTLGSSTEPAEILKNLDFTLDGMGLSLGNGPIEIGGSLVRVPGPTLQLDGTLLIKTAAFSFSALGSYTDLNGAISVMAFAVLLKELGDPTGTGAFVVTGLAFGFGVNRKLTLPTIEQVQNFPLVQAAMGKQDLATLANLPTKLRDYVAPSAGDFWIAAGIKLNSFVVLDSFLLLSVSWGAEIEIGMLGLSRMTVPPLAPPDQTIAGAELALRGVIRIAEGLIQFEARLTENSFIFSKTCRLTGGFAFCVWFAGPHAGDFMVSLGGYHPAFQRPAHYPLVPRLGMQLQIGTTLSITGEAYFALTPSCMMAGGKLAAVFKSGAIEAWFIAYADFLMSWQPFYYQAAIGITLGIALSIGSLKLRLELSVELKLQGPPFGGEARVTLWIISFTIPFGAPAAVPPPLTASDFVKKCLPPAKSAADSTPEVFSIRVSTGLLREQETEDANHTKRTKRIVAAHQLSMSVQTVVPCTEFEGLGKSAKRVAATEPCGIRPMGKTKLESTLTVTADKPIAANIRVSTISGNVPDALWGKSEKEGVVPLPEKAERKTIEAGLGIRIVCIPQKPEHSLAEIPIKEFAFENLPGKRVDWKVVDPPTDVPPQPTEWTDHSTIWTDSSVKQQRDGVLRFLRQHMPADLVLSEPNLEKLSGAPDYFLQNPRRMRVY